MQNTLAVLIISATALLWTIPARAAIIFDSFNGPDIGGITDAGNGGYMEVAVLQDVTINGISVLNQMLKSGSATFGIYRASDRSVVIETPALSLPADAGTVQTWKSSPSFSVTLVAGNTYLIGATIDAPRYDSADGVTETQNGLKSNLTIWVHDAFEPSETVRRFAAGWEPAVRLTAVPEPSTYALAAIGVVALLAVRRRKSLA